MSTHLVRRALPFDPMRVNFRIDADGAQAIPDGAECVYAGGEMRTCSSRSSLSNILGPSWNSRSHAGKI
jgi:hypothetical protein